MAKYEIKDGVGIIPEGTTAIVREAFKDCTELTSIAIPDSVTEIGYDAFMGCTGLTSIVIPDSVIRIGSSAFNGCTGLTSIVIGNSVTKIREFAFEGCTGLTSVVIGNSVTEICKFAFSGCFDLEKVVIPASVLKIDPEALGYNENLSLDLAADNPVYEMRGGHLLTKKDHVLVMGHPKEPIPEIVTEIGERAFNWCDDEVEEIVIPSSVKKIAEEAFRACNNMTKIDIPDSVTEIGDNAFNECDSLGELHLPSSLRKLGDILGGESINVYSHITDPRQCKVNYDEDEPESWVPNYDDWLYVPKGSLEIYQKTEPWCYFDTIKEF